jgi:hypothetical protein
MKTFKVYKHPDFGYTAVKIGISYPALLLGWIWLIANKFRGLGILFLFITVPLTFVLDTSQVTSDWWWGLTLLFIVLGVPAFMGNKWLASKYEKDGYKLVKVIQAGNKEAAIALVESNKSGD